MSDLEDEIRRQNLHFKLMDAASAQLRGWDAQRVYWEEAARLLYSRPPANAEAPTTPGVTRTGEALCYTRADMDAAIDMARAQIITALMQQGYTDAARAAQRFVDTLFPMSREAGPENTDGK